MAFICFWNKTLNSKTLHKAGPAFLAHLISQHPDILDGVQFTSSCLIVFTSILLSAHHTLPPTLHLVDPKCFFLRAVFSDF
jgi:hypothetical protein